MVHFSNVTKTHTDCAEWWMTNLSPKVIPRRSSQLMKLCYSHEVEMCRNSGHFKDILAAKDILSDERPQVLLLNTPWKLQEVRRGAADDERQKGTGKLVGIFSRMDNLLITQWYWLSYVLQQLNDQHSRLRQLSNKAVIIPPVYIFYRIRTRNYISAAQFKVKKIMSTSWFHFKKWPWPLFSSECPSILPHP